MFHQLRQRTFHLSVQLCHKKRVGVYNYIKRKQPEQVSHRLSFCDMEEHLGNRHTRPTGGGGSLFSRQISTLLSQVDNPEERKKKKRNNTVNSGHFVRHQHVQCNPLGHALCSNQFVCNTAVEVFIDAIIKKNTFCCILVKKPTISKYINYTIQ